MEFGNNKEPIYSGEIELFECSLCNCKIDEDFTYTGGYCISCFDLLESFNGYLFISKKIRHES
jgi:hypothetical protein